jgi:hypothetical protein
MNMRGNTQTSGDAQLDLSHIDAGIACLVGPNSCSGSNGDGEPCLPSEGTQKGSVCRTQLSRLASMYHYRNPETKIQGGSTDDPGLRGQTQGRRTPPDACTTRPNRQAVGIREMPYHGLKTALRSHPRNPCGRELLEDEHERHR